MIAVMYGAGSIGRGFIAQLFYDSGYDSVFVDVNRELIREINKRKAYPICFVESNSSKNYMIHNVSGICAQDTEGVVEIISKADIMATSVGKNYLPDIAENIAAGLKRRWKNKNYKYLNIIVCENMIKANEYLRELIQQYLNSDQIEFMDTYVGTVETCIGRNVPVMTKELYGDDPLRVLAEDYTLLPIDAESVKGPLPKLKYMVSEKNFGFYIRQKLFMYNMAHAVIAYLAAMRQDKKLCDSVKVPDIRLVALEALTESALAMAAEYNKSFKELLLYCHELLYRFGNTRLGISIPRLALDPIRKLSENDRLIGTAKLCMKNGVFPAHICIGIAAGYHYSNSEDDSARQLNKYIKDCGIEAAIVYFSKLEKKEPLYQYTLKYYNMFERGDSLLEIMNEAEKDKMHYS